MNNRSSLFLHETSKRNKDFYMSHTAIRTCFSALFSSNNPGKVGDWKTMFTEEQDEYFKSIFESKMENCALDFVWEEQEKEEMS